MGKTGHSVLITAVDQLSRLTLIKEVAHKDADDINAGLVALLGALPKEFMQSITPDHEIQERLGVIIYWYDLYSPEQRGTN